MRELYGIKCNNSFNIKEEIFQINLNFYLKELEKESKINLHKEGRNPRALEIYKIENEQTIGKNNEKNNEIEFCCSRLSTGCPKMPMIWESVITQGKRDFTDVTF